MTVCRGRPCGGESRAIVVVGDQKGQVGVGVAKADDVVNAFKKGKADARKKSNNISLNKIINYTPSCKW